jgi:hypothetical protein
MIFGLDPAVGTSNAAGVALFNPLIRRCVAADIIRPRKDLVGLPRILDVARRAADWALDALPSGEHVTVFVAEMPKIYPDERKKDPNTSLMPLAGVLAAVAAHLERDGRTPETFAPYPREWKGTIPGEVFCGRILERLDPRELAIVNAVMPAGLRHNAVDAVGLCLKYLGRMERSRVVHNEVG